MLRRPKHQSTTKNTRTSLQSTNGELYLSDRMSKRLAQLEFSFKSWIQSSNFSFTRKPGPPKSSDHSDSGMTAWCRDQAVVFELPELARKIRVSWNPRMRTTAGRAWWPARQIEINPKLKEFSDDEVWRTLKHEFAHLIAYERCGRRKIDPHGIEWQTACKDLGIAGESVYHHLPLKGRKMKRNHAYACPSCLAVIKRVRPFKKAVACYSCCKKFNSGSYHDRFRLIKNKI